MTELEKLKEEIRELQKDVDELVGDGLVNDQSDIIDEFENGWLYLKDACGQRYRVRAQVLRKKTTEKWKSERWDDDTLPGSSID